VVETDAGSHIELKVRCDEIDQPSDSVMARAG
jgi:hypothetical protein